MRPEQFTAVLALIGIVIVVSSLLSGLVERSGLPQVVVFLVLGAAIGPTGLRLIDPTLHSPTLGIITTLGLVLVLFTDAISVRLREVRTQWRVAVAVLGPGTLISAAIIAIAGRELLGLSAPAAAILGAALASTDPVLLRALLRRPELPAQARLGLRLESGMNDVVLLPIVIFGMLAWRSGGMTAGEVGRDALGLFLLGPGLGVAVGWVGIKALARVRDRVGVRRDYESLYALGLALGAYAAAEAVGGSGFLAAFAAGLMISALDVELCDCFLDYGQATAEMFLLLTFVAFGASLIWSGLGVIGTRTILFAAVALGVRTLVLLPVLAHAGVKGESRNLIAWFGPRGLSSLLLVLLPVFAGVPGSEALFPVTCLVVLLSILLHGGGVALYVARTRWIEQGRAEPAITAAPAPPEEDAEPAAPPADAPATITVPQLRELWSHGEPVVIVDARTDRTREQDDLAARDAVRLPPEDPVRAATQKRLSEHATLVVYCA